MGESTHEQHVYHDNGDKSNWFVFQVKPPRTTLRQMVAPCVFTGLFFFFGCNNTRRNRECVCPQNNNDKDIKQFQAGEL